VRLYVDTSALLKRYFDEPGSDSKHLSLIDDADVLVVNMITSAELLGAVRRAVTAGRLEEESALLVANDFEMMQEDFLWRSVDKSIKDKADEISWVTGSRGMDSIHIATALLEMCDVFLTADIRQYEASISVGMRSFLIS
jgi:predicted nucleic acid-binding protein